MKKTIILLCVPTVRLNVTFSVTVSFNSVVDDSTTIFEETFLEHSGNFFYRKLTIGTTIVTIEVNNNTYCLQKWIEMFSLKGLLLQTFHYFLLLIHYLEMGYL